MALFRDFSPVYGVENGAAFFLRMGAFRVSAVADMRAKFTESACKIGGIKKVEARKIENGEAGRVGDKAYVFVLFKGMQFHVARRLAAAFRTAADLPRFYGKIREEFGHHGGFTCTRAAYDGNKLTGSDIEAYVIAGNK